MQVEPRQRLVQQQHLAGRIEARPHLQQGAGNQHPLLLAPRQPAEVTSQQSFQLQCLAQCIYRLVLSGRCNHLIEPQAQHLKHRNMKQLGLTLGQHGAPFGKLGPTHVSKHFPPQQHCAIGG